MNAPVPPPETSVSIGPPTADGAPPNPVMAKPTIAPFVTVVIGDLAFLHDLNSLALLRSVEVPVVVVVINNRGGGIFSFLPIARHPDVFEPYFGTPHAWTFGHAAALFGLRYEAVDRPDAFVAAYREATAGSGSTVIEVGTDRQENYDLPQALLADVGRVLEG